MIDYPAIAPRHLRGAKLYADRYDMLRDIAARLPKYPTICEVGVGLGDFSEFLLRLLQPSRFVAIDWFRVHEVDQLVFGRPVNEVFGARTHAQFYRERFAGKPVEVLEGDSAETLSSLEDGSFDMIYVDANHEYDGVKADADAALRKMKRGGVLVFNDYILFDHLRGSEYGVVPVVNCVVDQTDWRIIAFALQHSMFCDVALARE